MFEQTVNKVCADPDKMNVNNVIKTNPYNPAQYNIYGL